MVLAIYGSVDIAPGQGELEMSKPLLHLVFGGEVSDPEGLEFVNVEELDIVGIYPNYAKALEAWRGASQARVDEACTKYVIVHMHRLLNPESE